jgi:hypothetical protein
MFRLFNRKQRKIYLSRVDYAIQDLKEAYYKVARVKLLLQESPYEEEAHNLYKKLCELHNKLHRLVS